MTTQATPCPEPGGEINLDNTWLHFCSARHAIDFLIAKTRHDGTWTNKPPHAGARPLLITTSVTSATP